ncbi:MAG: adenylate kinase [Candidatus Aminicenantaceae bacterium]
MRIILIGPPGSGKGTQGKLIQKRYSFPKISTGDLLRQEVAERTSLGKKAEAQMRKGGLVDDEIVVELVKERIVKDDCRQGYVLDGFPRNILQAQKLEEMDRNRPGIVIEIHLPEEVIIERLLARRICSECGAIYNLFGTKPQEEGICSNCGGKLILREDDKPDVIRERMKVYYRQTEPLINYFKQKRMYRRVDGTGEIQAVFCVICSVIEEDMAKLKEAQAPR